MWSFQCSFQTILVSFPSSFRHQVSFFHSKYPSLSFSLYECILCYWQKLESSWLSSKLFQQANTTATSPLSFVFLSLCSLPTLFIPSYSLPSSHKAAGEYISIFCKLLQVVIIIIIMRAPELGVIKRKLSIADKQTQ